MVISPARRASGPPTLPPMSAPPQISAIAGRAGARSAEIERARTLPTDLVEDLAATGVFRLWVPADLGGAHVVVLVGYLVFPLEGIALAVRARSRGWRP